jgi:hypothetical protein
VGLHFGVFQLLPFSFFFVKSLFIHRLTAQNATFSLCPSWFSSYTILSVLTFVGLKILSSSKLCSWCIVSGVRGVVCAYSLFLVLYTIRPYPVSLRRDWYLVPHLGASVGLGLSFIVLIRSADENSFCYIVYLPIFVHVLLCLHRIVKKISLTFS